MTKSSLFVFSIGPVQSFIASARKMEDLWSGSYLLSYLSEAAIHEAASEDKLDVEMIFPSVVQTKPVENEEIASLPNRFLCRVTTSEEENHDEQVKNFAANLEKTVQTTFKDLCSGAIGDVFPSGNEYMLEMAEAQIDDFLEIYWAFEHELDYQSSRERLEKKLAAAKNNKQYSLGAQNGLICTVCSQRESLSLSPHDHEMSYPELKKKAQQEWAQRSRTFKENESKGIIKDNERLCAVCLGKRYTRRHFKKLKGGNGSFGSFPSTRDIADSYRYYGVLLMDGDDMGKWISGAEGKKLSGFDVIDIRYHQEVSMRLGKYASSTVPDIVNHIGTGTIVYAGGDDVLAFVPLPQVFETAGRLRAGFSQQAKGLDEKATSSMGIIIAHEEAPLKQVLQNARIFEKKAKSYRNNTKNALSLGVYTRGGEIREVTLPWSTKEAHPFAYGTEGCVMSALQQIEKVLNEQLSTTFISKLGEALKPLGIETNRKPELSAAISTVISEDKHYNNPGMDARLIKYEIQRLLIRSIESNDAQIQKITDILVDLYHTTGSLREFIHTLEILRFFRSKKREGSNNESIHETD